MSDRLTVTVAAEARRLTTLDAFKAELGITGTDSDDSLERTISQASAAIESYCGRVFALQEYRQDVRLDNRQESVALRAWPVTILDAVTVDGAALTEDSDFEADNAAGLLSKITANRPGKWPKGCKITVEFSAGYILPGDTGEDLPADVERACLDLAKAMYFAGDRDPAIAREVVPQVHEVTFNAGSAGAAHLPPGVAALLEPYRAQAYV